MSFFVRQMFAVLCVFPILCLAQVDAQSKRAFGIVPNYKTVDPGTHVLPLTAKQKFTIAAKDTFDWPILPVAGVMAGIAQASNSNPSFGQGMKGYGKRFLTGYADQALTTIGMEGLFPVLLKEDMRYYRKGSGSGMSRGLYAASRVLVTKSDAGHKRFNFSELLGNGSAAALGVLYYPDATHGRDIAIRTAGLIAADALGNLLKEFWPDVQRMLRKRHKQK